MEIQEIHQGQQWNELLLRLPEPHILQTWEWGEFKSRYGWRARRLAFWADGQPVAAASILQRRAGPLKVQYVPKGPILDPQNLGLVREVLGSLEAQARRERAIFVKIDPDVVLRQVPAEEYPPAKGADSLGMAGSALTPQPPLEQTPLRVPLGGPAGEGERHTGNQPGGPFVSVLSARGWQYSAEQIQFRNTVVIDLGGSEDEWLARMKSKTRYNIRLAERKGVTIRQAGIEELPKLYEMYAETATRDAFIIRPLEYYQQAWGSFLQAGLAAALVAQYQGEPLAAVILFAFGRRAWYFYGMSRDVHRNLMPTYLLQWAGMRWARDRGCTEYDLWGAPEVFDERDPMWGVYRFKQGLGGCVVQHIGAYDYPTSKGLYWAYTEALPRYLDMLRGLYRRRQAREQA